MAFLSRSGWLSASSKNWRASGSFAKRSFLNDSDQISKLSLAPREGISLDLSKSVFVMREIKSRFPVLVGAAIVASLV